MPGPQDQWYQSGWVGSPALEAKTCNSAVAEVPVHHRVDSFFAAAGTDGVE